MFNKKMFVMLLLTLNNFRNTEIYGSSTESFCHYCECREDFMIICYDLPTPDEFDEIPQKQYNYSLVVMTEQGLDILKQYKTFYDNLFYRVYTFKDFTDKVTTTSTTSNVVSTQSKAVDSSANIKTTPVAGKMLMTTRHPT